MKRYIKSSYDDTLRELGITADQLKQIEDYAYSVNDWDDNLIGFEHPKTSQWIYNIFLDPTGRFDLTIEDAVKKYGIANCHKFCQDVLKEINR